MIPARLHIVFFVELNYVDEAGVRTWGIPAASAHSRRGWSPWFRTVWKRAVFGKVRLEQRVGSFGAFWSQILALWKLLGIFMKFVLGWFPALPGPLRASRDAPAKMQIFLIA